MSPFRRLLASYKLVPFLLGLLILLNMGDVSTPMIAWSQQAGVNPAAQSAVGTAFTYQGRLSNNSSGAVTGQYDFQFTLYDAETGGTVIGAAQTKSNVGVSNGVFTVHLDFGPSAFTGAPRWLELAVRQANTGNFETLAPRQPLTPVPYAIYADTTNLNTVQARVSGTCADGSSIRVINGDGTVTCEPDDVGQARVSGTCADGSSIRVINPDGTVTCEPDDIGGNNHNHLGQTWPVNGNPLIFEGTVTGLNDAPLIIRNSGNGSGLVIRTQGSDTSNGINVESSSSYATIYAENKGNGFGVRTFVQNSNAVYAQNNSEFATVYSRNTGTGTGGWFTAYNSSDILVAQEEVTANSFNTRFRVALDGQVYADKSFNPNGADFAEMLPAVSGLVPGDVLVIGPEGTLVPSSTPNATSLAGVYSTQPGFVGGLNSEQTSITAASNPSAYNGNSMAGQAKEERVVGTVATPKTRQPDSLTLAYAQQGKIPLAILGVVPVKVTTENGPIQPGDLLTTSSTPGHAMKASPVNLAGIELYRPGTILGKALEPWADGAGMIQVLIVLQ